MMASKVCPYCAEEIQDAAIKCRHCGEWLGTPPPDAARSTWSAPAPTTTTLFRRSSSDAMLAGVCGGLARYLGIDSTMLRVMVALTMVFTVVVPGLIVYLILAILVPKDDEI